MDLVHEDVLVSNYVVLIHPDGRRWSARAVGAEIRMCVVDGDGDRTMRRRKLAGPGEVKRTDG